MCMCVCVCVYLCVACYSNCMDVDVLAFLCSPWQGAPAGPRHCTQRGLATQIAQEKTGYMVFRRSLSLSLSHCLTRSVSLAILLSPFLILFGDVSLQDVQFLFSFLEFTTP